MNYDGLSKLGYGMYLIGVEGNALLANLVMQAASDPPTICVSISKKNLTHDILAKTGKFSVSVLTEEADLAFLTLFGFKSGRDECKLDQVECQDYEGIKTVTQHCNALLACQVENQVDCGSATVFFGKVIGNKALSPAKSMTLDYYQSVVEGRVSPNAPAFAARYVK